MSNRRGSIRTVLWGMAMAALAAVLGVGSDASPVSAQSSGGCRVTIDGVDMSTAATPDTALELAADATVTLIAEAPGPVTSAQVKMLFGPLGITVAETDIASNQTRFVEEVNIADVAAWGVGIYQVEAITTGTVCNQTAYIKIVGKSVLSSAAGLAAAVATAVGAAGVGTAAISGLRRRAPRRLLGGTTGLLAGMGVALLAQQSGAVPLTGVRPLGIIILLSILGVVLTWLLAAWRSRDSKDSANYPR